MRKEEVLQEAKGVCEETCVDFGRWVGLVLSRVTDYVQFRLWVFAS